MGLSNTKQRLTVFKINSIISFSMSSLSKISLWTWHRAMLLRRSWPHVHRMYDFRHRRPLKLYSSAEADDARFISNSRTSDSTVGNMERMAGAIFWSVSTQTDKLATEFSSRNAGRRRNMSNSACSVLEDSSGYSCTTSVMIPRTSTICSSW